MQELILRDSGGVEPEASDLISDELVTFLDGINTTLGTEKDPRFGEYQEFLNSINEASILKIDQEQMSSGKYDGLDLTGEEDPITVAVVKEPKDENFFNGMTIEEYVKIVCLFSPNSNLGISYDKDYCPVQDGAFVLPSFKVAQ